MVNIIMLIFIMQDCHIILCSRILSWLKVDEKIYYYNYKDVNLDILYKLSYWFILFLSKLVMFYSCPVLGDFGATKNAKGRVLACEITDARKHARNSPCISRFDLLRRETWLRLPYDSLSFFMPPDPPARNKPVSISRGRIEASLSLPGKDRNL